MGAKYQKWEIGTYDRAEAKELCARGMTPLLSVLLAARGMKDRTEELLGELPAEDPFALKDMDRAAERLRRAIRDGERVGVYGDYDVDGITASCLVAEYLTEKGLENIIYIPERLEEGYGVKSAGLDSLRARGCTLVITVDCGVTAVEEAAHARDIGLDMIITDHHECAGRLPDAAAVVDPKRPDCPSRSKMLAGVGVAYKLLCAVEGAEREPALMEKYGDLAAVGTVADVMPVVGENRRLIRRGLELVKTGQHIGLREIAAAAGCREKYVTVANVGYTIAPRINAAGRLGRTDVAVELLRTRDEARATELANELCAMNRERQTIEAAIFEEALDKLRAAPPEGKPIVLAGHDWHQGVAGIVASRVAEKYALPTVMISLKDGVGRGSCRSVGGFSIYEALKSCSGCLMSFGGHDMAAGLVIEEDRIDELRRQLGERYSRAPGRAETVLHIDFEVIKPRLLSLEDVASLAALEPCGAGNPQATLCIRDAAVENVVPLSEGKHTKLWLNKDGETLEAVFFRRSAAEMGAEPGMRADVAFTPQINEFRGRRSVQLNLQDFRPAE